MSAASSFAPLSQKWIGFAVMFSHMPDGSYWKAAWGKVWMTAVAELALRFPIIRV
jgi:hypothetical protein